MQGFAVRDHICLAKKKQTFKQRYETNFTDEIVKVVKVIREGNFFLYEVCVQADNQSRARFTNKNC